MLDPDGAPLSAVDVVGPVDDGRIELGRVEEPGSLLAYCFGKGRRRVRLSVGQRAVEGRLATRWQGDRRGWWLEVDA